VAGAVRQTGPETGSDFDVLVRFRAWTRLDGRTFAGNRRGLPCSRSNLASSGWATSGCASRQRAD
jgi:hypothetical protein